MKILASTFILLTLLSACYPQSSQGRMGMSGHEGNESASMEALEGPGR